ncbi:MAG: hypothetical protein ACOCT9_01720 [archaeon]
MKCLRSFGVKSSFTETSYKARQRKLFNNIVKLGTMNKTTELKFIKINYMPLHLTDYHKKDVEPRELFNERLKRFFVENFEKENKYRFQNNDYQIAALSIEENLIFGKLWKLKERKDKEFPWTGDDYDTRPQYTDDYQFNYFLFTLDTHHGIIEDQHGYSSTTVMKVFKNWFEKHFEIEEGFNYQYIKNKKKFMKLLNEAHKITYAKFTLYPSNIDYDFISKPLDDELHKLGIDELSEEMKSEEGIEKELERPNLFSSSLVQSLRGNGEDPIIKTQDEKGNIEKISTKIEKVVMEVEKLENIKKMKNILLSQLKEIIDE